MISTDFFSSYGIDGSKIDTQKNYKIFVCLNLHKAFFPSGLYIPGERKNTFEMYSEHLCEQKSWNCSGRFPKSFQIQWKFCTPTENEFKSSFPLKLLKPTQFHFQILIRKTWTYTICLLISATKHAYRNPRSYLIPTLFYDFLSEKICNHISSVSFIQDFLNEMFPLIIITIPHKTVPVNKLLREFSSSFYFNFNKLWNSPYSVK